MGRWFQEEEKRNLLYFGLCAGGGGLLSFGWHRLGGTVWVLVVGVLLELLFELESRCCSITMVGAIDLCDISSEEHFVD